jgi:alkanesulfonate monooxygenase SsuD/methylene tetrahydromethanopterin reductase-like flavin-dependent oxidoreductase (luciferase family)
VLLGLGIAAGSDPDQVAGLAGEAEALGYDSIWANDHPAGDGLAQLWAWAQASARIRLCVGVLALDRHQPEDIAARVRELGLPLDRILIGLGSGFTDAPLRAVREGVAALRSSLPRARVAVAAMGPKMCHIAGEVGDAVLLNWMTPERAAWARPLVEQGVRDSGRQPADVPVYGYVRVAIGPDAGERLEREVSMYLQMPHYKRHFDAMAANPGRVGIGATDPADVGPGIRRYSALDEPVVRVLSQRAPADILAVARAAMGL